MIPAGGVGGDDIFRLVADRIYVRNHRYLLFVLILLLLSL